MPLFRPPVAGQVFANIYRPRPRVPYKKRPQRLYAKTANNIYEQIGSGGITFAGAATVLRTFANSGSGGLTFAGSATIARTRVVTGSGGIVFAGAATVARTFVPPTPTGGIVFAGAATVNRGWIRSGSGEIVFDGSASVARTFVITASGGLIFSGASDVTLILTTPTLAQVEGATRNEIFKRFLRETGLGSYGVVTGIGGGATSTLDDTTRLKSSQFNTDAWKGGWVRIAKNSNSNGTAPEGDVSAITAYDPTTNGRLTFSPVVTGNIEVGDEYELWRFPSPAFVIDDLNTVLKEDVYLPCWTVLSEAPDFDMEQNNTTDWTAGNGNTTLSKASGEPSLDGARWLALSTNSGNAGSAYNANEISVQPSTKYFVSVVCYNHNGNTLTLEAYDATNSATIDSRDWTGRFPGRVHFEFTTPSTCKSLRIYLKHAASSGSLVSYWDELCLYPSGSYDIALPWWVKNKNQIKAIFRLSPSDIDTDVWDSTLRGEFYNSFEIRDNAFGRGQLRLVIERGTLPGILFMFGVRNETSYSDDNTDNKRIDENFLVAALATKVFRRLKTFPNSNAMQTTWIEKQYEEWETRYKQLSRQQSTRVEEITQSYRATGQYLDPRFALNR